VQSDGSDPSASPPAIDPARLRAELARAIAHLCPSWLADRADDMAQNAVLRVLDILRRGEGSTALPSSYLQKVAYSALIDELRRVRRHTEVAIEEGDDAVSPPSEAPDPEQISAGKEQGRAIRHCLERLIRPRRLAVTLHLQGHPVKELAQLLGWTVKRADNLVYRGISDLRDCLRAKGIRP
jgi:RNA polymerase sigma-70 factor (ECF subfamily)